MTTFQDRSEQVALDTYLSEQYERMNRALATLDIEFMSIHSAVDKKEYVGRSRKWKMTHLEAWDAFITLLTNDDDLDYYEKMSYERWVKTVEKVNEAGNAVQDAQDESRWANEFYTDWSRFYLVTPKGHIHSSMYCSTCYDSTHFVWLPELSGLTEADAVEQHGAILCTVCYPSAPVEWTNGYDKNDEDYCQGKVNWNGMSKRGECECGAWPIVSERTGLARKHKSLAS